MDAESCWTLLLVGTSTNMTLDVSKNALTGGIWWIRLQPMDEELFLCSCWDFKVDPKKRVSLPAQYREALRRRFGSEAIVLTITPDRCLSGHPASLWPSIAEASRPLLELGANGADFRRLFLAMMKVVEPDPHGRILLPPQLHGFAGIGRIVHYIGMGNRFELWDGERFEALLRQVDLEALRGPFNELASRFPA